MEPRILVVDDDADSRCMYEEFGRARSVHVEVVATTDGALAAVAVSAFDLIVCDFNLARETSEALVHELLRLGLAVIVVTGSLYEALRAFGTDVCVLSKPVRFEEIVLRARVSRARTDRRRMP